MDEQLTRYLTDLSDFLGFFVVSLFLVVVFVAVYTNVTRHSEIKLIKENSVAAAVAFSGSMIGFALPLASAMISSSTILEMIIWGVVAMIVQIVVYLLVRLPMPRVSERIENNEIAAGLWLGVCQWRSKKGPPRRCKKGPLGGCGLVPVVHGRAPRTTRRALNRLTRRRAREGPVGPRGQAWAGWSVQLAVGV